MMLSEDLFRLAGLFEQHRRTGCSISAQETHELMAALAMAGEAAEQLERALKSITEEFDRYIEDQHADVPGVVAMPRSVRAFDVILGGRQ